MNILPIDYNHSATVNYSILGKFKSANIYRFFCLSLCRDEWYNVRITLNDLKDMTGEKSLTNFNKDFKEYLDIKPYFINNSFRYKTRRNIYHVPAMDEQCITISDAFLDYDLHVKSKGFFIQLMLLSQFGNIELNKENIISVLKIDRKTYDKYLLGLINTGLVTNGNILILHTNSILLENDFSKQKKIARKKFNEKVEIDDDFKITLL